MFSHSLDDKINCKLIVQKEQNKIVIYGWRDVRFEFTFSNTYLYTHFNDMDYFDNNCSDILIVLPATLDSSNNYVEHEKS